MALSSKTLSDLLFEKFEEKMGKVPKESQKHMRNMTDALAEAVIEHIKSSATVTITIPATPPAMGTVDYTGTVV